MRAKDNEKEHKKWKENLNILLSEKSGKIESDGGRKSENKPKDIIIMGGGR